jgi:hypothetical protein
LTPEQALPTSGHAVDSGQTDLIAPPPVVIDDEVTVFQPAGSYVHFDRVSGVHGK